MDDTTGNRLNSSAAPAEAYAASLDLATRLTGQPPPPVFVALEVESYTSVTLRILWESAGADGTTSYWLTSEGELCSEGREPDDDLLFDTWRRLAEMVLGHAESHRTDCGCRAWCAMRPARALEVFKQVRAEVEHEMCVEAR